MNASASKFLGLIAFLVTLGSTYITTTTYSDVIRYQAKAKATYYVALDAWNNWTSDVDPGQLPDWVKAHPASVAAGIPEVKHGGLGTLLAWGMFVFSKWNASKRKEET